MARTFGVRSWNRGACLVAAGLVAVTARAEDPGDVVWAKHTASSGSSSSFAVAALPDGSSVVAGSFISFNVFGDGEPGETFLNNTSNNLHPFMARYRPDGTLAWAIRPFPSITRGEVQGVASFADGSFVVTGECSGAQLGGGVSVSGMFVARYDGAGNRLWLRSGAGAGTIQGLAVSSVPDGSCVVAGEFRSTVNFGPTVGGGPDVVFSPDGARLDAFLAKYDASGGLAWVQRLPGVGGSLMGAAAFADGSSILAGRIAIGTYTIGTPPHSVTLTGDDPDYLVARFGPDGTLAWARRAGGTNASSIRGAAAFPDGSSVVTGQYSGTVVFGSGETNQTALQRPGPGPEVFVARFEPDGDLAWVRRAGAVAGSTAMGMAATAFPDGTAAVSGTFRGTAIFGPDDPQPQPPLVAVSSSDDVFVASYRADGTVQWARGAAGDGAANAIAGFAGGALVVTGEGARFGIEPPATPVLNKMFVARLAGTSAPADPPVVSIDTPASGAVVGVATVGVTASVTHPSATTVVSVPAGVSASLPAGGGTASGTAPLAVEGPNTITVSATDAFGNVGGTSVEVIRDTTAPVVVVTSPAAGAVVGMSPVDVTVNVQDLTATTIEVAGASQDVPAGGGSRTFSVALVPGANDVEITATDAAGHATSLTRRIVLDLDAPVVSIDAPTDGQRFGASPAAVVARVDDLSATSVASVPVGVAGPFPDGGGVALGAVDLVEGTNTITVSATDAAGLVGSAAVTVVLDTTPPTASIVSPHAGDAVRGVVDLHVAADDPLPGSSVASVALTLDGNPLTTLTAAPFETTLDTTGLADGPHLLAVTATDGLGHAGAPVSITVVVDNTAPAVAILSPAHGATVGGTAAFTVTVADPVSGVAEATMTVGAAAPTTDASRSYATPVASDVLHGAEDTTQRPDGPATFAVTVRDAAGNVATASATVDLDNSNPASSLVAPHEGDVVRGTIRIEAAASDPNLAGLTLLVDGVEVATSSTSPLVAPFDTTTRIDGPMTVELRVTDTVGNAGTSAVHVTVDNAALEIQPSLLHLKANGPGGGAPVDATLTGPNLALLLPTESHAIELRMPGGNSVQAAQGWDGDDALSGPGLTRLKLRFARSALVASIRAGIAGGQIDAASRQVEVTLVADGRVQGVVVLGFTEGK